MASKTPWTTVNVNTEKDAQRTLRRRSVADDPASSVSAKSAPGSASKRQRQIMAEPTPRRSPRVRRSVGGQEEGDVTPRHLIQNMLTVQGTAQPITRRKQRVSDVIMRPPLSTSTRKVAKRRSSVGGLDLDDVTRKFTPRTNILGFLDQAPEITPDMRQAVASSDSHSTTQNVSSYINLNVNEVGVSLLVGSSSKETMMNISSSGGRFRSKKRNLNIQLPQVTPGVRAQTPQSAGKASKVSRTPSRSSTKDDLHTVPSSVPSSPAADSEDPQNTSRDRLNTSAVSEREKSRHSERNIFSDIFEQGGDADHVDVESVENAPDENSGVEVERFQGGRKSKTPTALNKTRDGESQSRGTTPQSGRKSQSSQRTLSSMWSSRRTSGLEDEREPEENDNMDLNESGSSTRTLRFSKTRTESIADATVSGSALKGTRKSGTPSPRLLSSANRNARQTPQSSSALDVSGSKSNRTAGKNEWGSTSVSSSRTPASSHTPSSSGQSLRLSARKGSSGKNQSQFSVGNITGSLEELDEDPFPDLLQGKTPVTSTPRVSSNSKPPPMIPTPDTSNSRRSSVRKSSGFRGHTPASVQLQNMSGSAKGGGSTGKSSRQLPRDVEQSSSQRKERISGSQGKTPASAQLQNMSGSAKGGGSTGKSSRQLSPDTDRSFSQRRSKSSVVSRLSGRFDALESASQASGSERSGPSVLDAEDQVEPTTSDFAEIDARGDEQMPGVLPNEADEDESDEEEDGYSPLKTPRLPEKQPTPATVISTRDKNTSVKIGASQTGTKRKAAVSSRPAKRPRHGLPTSTIKALFTHFCHLRVSKEAIKEVVKISDQFLQNMAEDVEAYATHAHRQTINMSDFELLMRRQGFITDTCSLNTLIAKYLPLELRQELIPIARSGNQLEPKG
ncbi:serine-rich adhesin for platelets-like [Littorina saxatilis]|uniref:CENP-T/Histone H4 histone fold domain-containing protein n=1 Tax=Littorina saxatilis TaxID=31220 RepID=A0AAN9BYV1_9CAEN